MSIVPLFGLEAFGPDDIKAMSIALDGVCKILDLTDDKQEQREVLARRIIALARRGEHDPAGLRDGVLRELAVSAWRGLSYPTAPSTNKRGPACDKSLRERGACAAPSGGELYPNKSFDIGHARASGSERPSAARE